MSKTGINFVRMIDKVKLENNSATSRQNVKERTTQNVKELTTTDMVRLNSWQEISEKSDREIVKSPTDFALLTGAFQSNTYTDENFIKTNFSFLRSAFSRTTVDNVDFVGWFGFDDVNYKGAGFSPALSLNPKSFISARKDSNEDIRIESYKTKSNKTRHILKLGEYPKSAVGEELQEKLESLYNGGELQEGLKCTGKVFTTNGEYVYGKDFLSKQNPEFEYNGEKYVRVMTCRNENMRFFANGCKVPMLAGQAVWVKVEPISFLIKNWDKLPKSINPNGDGKADTIEIETDQDILSGMPFYPNINDNNCSLWQNSLIRAFLNSANSKDLDKNHDYEAPLQWDFSQGGWLNQALDLSREPIREYVVPQNEKAICAYAFEGCVALEKIVIHEGVKRIGTRAFAGCKKTQLVFENLNSKFKLDTDAHAGTKFKYIYLSKEGDKTIFSPTLDNELEKSCIRSNYSFDVVKNIFNQSYRHNIVNVTNWKEEKKIKFIPPEYTLQIFPSFEMQKYFLNNNNQRWGKLVKTLGFDTLKGTEKNNSLVDLMKIYYAIGGFSENQGESEKAFDFVLKYVANGKPLYGSSSHFEIVDSSPAAIGAEIHSRFSKMVLKGPYNPLFAQFFMKYYGQNPDFMNFRLKDKDGVLMDSQDYLCAAHNVFENILKLYPNRVVNGNEERALLTPRFVAEHCSYVEYEYVDDGNELLAEIVGKYGYSQNQFEAIQEIYNKAKSLKDRYVIRADKASENSPIQFRVLSKDDPLGFVLGDITNCCQVLGGAGESCVDDGYTNPNAGFLVFEESILDEMGKPTGETRVLGQAYIWYDEKTKTVCYDNIEIPTKVLDELRKGDRHGERISSSALIDAVVDSADAIMSAMNRNGVKVKRVTTGEGYNDLKKELSRKFKKEVKPKARHRNYSGYTDADDAQYVIRTYDQTTKMYERVINYTIKEARKDLEEISQWIYEPEL